MMGLLINGRAPWGVGRRGLSAVILVLAMGPACAQAWATPSAEEASARAGRVRLAFVGDVMLAETPGALVRQGRDPLAPMAALLREADVRVANLECVVARGGKARPGKPYTFRAHPRTLRVLRRHFDAVSLANNHSGDYGPEAFTEMLGHLERSGVAYFGGGRNLIQAHQPWVVERNGLRIALLGYNEFLPRSFEANQDKPGVAWSEDEQVRRDILAARQVHKADLVIPVMHWGWEYQPLASPRQHQLARWMIDAGADAVIGGHPHVVQDTAVYRGKPIVFSLGNFVFNGFSDVDTTTGWLLSLEVDRQGVMRWRTHVARLDGQGVPHPSSTDAQCWERDWAAARACAGH